MEMGNVCEIKMTRKMAIPLGSDGLELSSWIRLMTTFVTLSDRIFGEAF